MCREATGPYEIDPADCQKTMAGHLASGVIGTGVAAAASIDVVSNSGMTPLGDVMVNGHQASGMWIPVETGSVYIGTIPTADLFFPNLDLMSTSIQPPYPATNVITAPVPIGSASLEIQGTRPVILVHGIAGPQLTLDYLSVLHGIPPTTPFAANVLNAWSTWSNWLAPNTQPQGPHIDMGAGYLRRIGVPNIRPNEENGLANHGNVICNRTWKGAHADGTCDAPCDVSASLREPSVPGPLDRIPSCIFPSDARAYTWAYADYRSNKWFLLNMVHMIQRRYGVQQVNIVAHSKGTQDTEDAVAMDPGAFGSVILQAPMYRGTNLADHLATLLHTLARLPPASPLFLAIANAARTMETEGQPTLTQLTTSYWKQQGQGLLDAVPSAPPIDTVAGTDGCNMANGIPATIGFASVCQILDQLYLIPNDGAVPVYSVKAVPKATFYEFHVDHIDMNQWDEVFANTCNLLQAPTIGPPCAQKHKIQYGPQRDG